MAKKKKDASAKGDSTSSDGAIAVWTQRARGWGLLVGFGLGFVVAHRAGLPLVDAALRGVLAAFVMSLVLWWCSLMVIQGLIRTVLVRRIEERDRAHAEIVSAQEAAAATSSNSDPGLYGDNLGGFSS